MATELGPNPTAQEVYEFMRAYFSRPGARLAKVDGVQCVYRDASDGAKCAVGCLIPDELYNAPYLHPDNYDGNWSIGDEIEGNGVEEILGYSPQLKDLLNGETEEGYKKLDFLIAAQKAHDRQAEDAAHLVGLLDEIASTCHLELVTA